MDQLEKCPALHCPSLGVHELQSVGWDSTSLRPPPLERAQLVPATTGYRSSGKVPGLRSDMDEETSHLDIRGKSVTGRRNNRCKGPGAASPRVHDRAKRQRSWSGGVTFPSDFSSNEGIDTLLGMRPSWLLQTCFGERPCSVMIQRILFRCQKCLGLDEKITRSPTYGEYLSPNLMWTFPSSVKISCFSFNRDPRKSHLHLEALLYKIYKSLNPRMIVCNT